ncbi:MAG: hypothetical protein ACTS43_00080 [Candidatus Hodgkinia cicadicola]
MRRIVLNVHKARLAIEEMENHLINEQISTTKSVLMSEDTFRPNQSSVIQVYLINSFVPFIAGNYYNFDGVSIRTSLEIISLRHVQPSNAKLTYVNGLRSNPCDVRQRSINFIIYRRFVSKLITLEINLLHFETSIPLALEGYSKIYN